MKGHLSQQWIQASLSAHMKGKVKGVTLGGFVPSTVCLFLCSQLSTLAAISRLVIVKKFFHGPLGTWVSCQVL